MLHFPKQLAVNTASHHGMPYLHTVPLGTALVMAAGLSEKMLVLRDLKRQLFH